MAVHSAPLIDATGTPVGDMRRIDATASLVPCTLKPWTVFSGSSKVIDRRLLDLLAHDRATRDPDSNDPGHSLGHDG